MKVTEDTNIYYINVDRESRNTAGAKAPRDVADICKKYGCKEILMPYFPKGKNTIYQKLWLVFVCGYHWLKIMNKVKKDDIVIFQHPFYGNRMSEKMIPVIQKRKGAKFIVLIHDLESLRGGIAGVIKNNEKTNQIADNNLLKHFDAVICHNERMKQYLISQDFEADRLVNLDIFDYLSDSDCIKPVKDSIPSIAIAGNLAKGKCGYIYGITSKEENRNTTLKIHLFGINYEDAEENENMMWHGSFKPEELPDYLKGEFGLVWDGTSYESCIGNTGEYLRYNNPHKTSLYLSAGMPVIVWKQAAIAEYVLKNNVGIVVENLAELEDAIKKITLEEYMVMCENVKNVSKKLRDGYYTWRAIEEAIEKI